MTEEVTSEQRIQEQGRWRVKGTSYSDVSGSWGGSGGGA